MRLHILHIAAFDLILNSAYVLTLGINEKSDYCIKRVDISTKQISLLI